MAETCDTCIHEEVCSLWRQVECQDASCFQLDGCKYYREAAAHWIPVTERLPETSDDVIIYLDKGIRGEVTIGFNAGDHKWYIDIGYEVENTVTHWMPLPEPPGEVDDGE